LCFLPDKNPKPAFNAEYFGDTAARGSDIGRDMLNEPNNKRRLQLHIANRSFSGLPGPAIHGSRDISHA
jgi:hypothetical protein